MYTVKHINAIIFTIIRIREIFNNLKILFIFNKVDCERVKNMTIGKNQIF